MTIYKIENFDYIYNGLRKIDHDLFHFCLTASEETIKKRIEKRGDTFGAWYQQHTEAGVLAFRNQKFQEHIETDYIDTDEVIRIILNRTSKL